MEHHRRGASGGRCPTGKGGTGGAYEVFSTYRPAKTFPSPWESFADADVLVDEVPTELAVGTAAHRGLDAHQAIRVVPDRKSVVRTGCVITTNWLGSSTNRH